MPGLIFSATPASVVRVRLLRPGRSGGKPTPGAEAASPPDMAVTPD
ncbi:MAG: hypothetical protein LVS60_04500 [Nodosilinea sp. LVE1205-7]